jgi:hypothetical protein
MKPNGWRYVGIAVLILVAVGIALPARAEKNLNLAFVSEYIRELAEYVDKLDNANNELKASNFSKEIPSTIIHSSTLIQLTLRSQISALKSMHLDHPFDDIIPTIIKWYETKIDLYQRIIDINSIFLAGPKPDVDYDKLAAEMPKIRAQIDYVDESLFRITPMIFATLIDQKPDSKNHLSHLIITKNEKEKLLHDLTTAFGKKLEQKNPSYIIGSARVLKTYLSKDYKCSDEPWQ